LDLTAKEFALLHYFMSRPGEVVSQEELLEHVWDEHADPFTNTVRVTVGTLRRKLAVDGEPGLIETVVGRGYRLLGGEPPEGAAR
jgi:DNA-binding response OmpR family regulator